MSARLAALAVALAGLLRAGDAAASAQELFGVGPRDVALAGAAGALGDHYGAAYYDPAGMSDAKRVRFTVLWFQAESHLTIDGEAARGAAPTRAASMGMVVPLPMRGAMEDRIVVGFVSHAPKDRLIRVYSRPADEPQFVLLQNHAQVLGLYLGGSFRITRSFAFGASARMAADVRAKVDLQGNEGGTATTSNGFLSTTVTPIYALRWAPPTGAWRASLVYRHHFRQVFATPASNDLSGLRTPTPGLKATTLYVPTQVIASGAWQPGPWTATLDVAWKRWSEFPDPTVELGRLQTSTAIFPKFHDTVSARTGIERRLAAGPGELVLRGGYGFEPTPAPAMVDDYNFFDNDRHVVGLGAGYAFPWRAGGRIRVEAAVQGHLLADRTHTKDPAKVPAGSDLAYETKGDVRMGTVGVTWEY